MVYIKFNYCKFIFKMSKLFDNFSIDEDLRRESSRENESRFEMAFGTSNKGYMM